MRSICLAVLVLLISAPTGFAHALRVACVIRHDKVEVETFFSDETPAPRAMVQVVNADGDVVEKGETDERGQWTFARPKPGEYEVRADAGAGHRAKRTIHVASENASAGGAVPAKATISDEPTRDDLTRTPWLEIVIGLIVIGGLSGAYLIASSWRKR